MPVAEVTMMANKYGALGGHSVWSKRVGEAVMLWETGAAAMVERERTLHEFKSIISRWQEGGASMIKPTDGQYMESVGGRLLYAHKLSVHISELLQDSFRDTFTLRGRPYPPEDESIAASSLADVIAYAHALADQVQYTLLTLSLLPTPSHNSLTPVFTHTQPQLTHTHTHTLGTHAPSDHSPPLPRSRVVRRGAWVCTEKERERERDREIIPRSPFWVAWWSTRTRWRQVWPNWPP